MLKYLKASHLAPTLLVTTLAFFLAHQLFGFTDSLIIGFTIFTGQLLVGWTNDLVDVHSDRLQVRSEKPLVYGELLTSSLLRAIKIDLPICVTLSLFGPLGVKGGLLHLFGVGCGVSYNFFFKKRALSVLPYTLAFAALPATPYVSLGMAPPWWMIVVGGGFGTVAHFANVLEDLQADWELGSRGLPQRIGVNQSIALCVVVLLLITPIIASHRPQYEYLAYSALVVGLIVLVARPKKLGFNAIMALALIDVLITAIA